MGGAMTASTTGVIRRMKFDEAAKLDVSFQDLAFTVRDGAIKDVAGAYSENMQRVLSLLELPLNLVALLTRWKAIQDERFAAQRSTTSSNPNVFEGLTQEQIKEARMQQKEGEERAKYLNDIDFGWDAMNDVFQIVLRQIPETDTRKMVQGCEAVLSAMIIGTWTAFETMAGDLWEAAINVCPKTLAELRGSGRRIWQHILDSTRSRGVRIAEPSQPGVSQGGSKGPTDSKKVDLDRMAELTDGTFNLGPHMGTLLRPKFEFSILGDIRAAYGNAFWTHSNHIDEALSDRAIDALNLVRNLLVHNAGVADQIYLNGIPGTPAPILGVNDQLVLDGAIVLSLVNPVVQRSSELIKAVDRWIQDEANGIHRT